MYYSGKQGSGLVVKRKLIWNMAAVLLLSSCTNDDSSQLANPSAPQDNVPEAASSSAGKETWQPVPFDPSVTTFKPGYEGTGSADFSLFFKRISDKNTKGEYETTKAYKDRVKDLAESLNPLSPSSLYAFKLSNILFNYDADLAAYKVLAGGCDRNEISSKPYASCLIYTQVTQSGNYVGSNAFGTSRVVKQERGNDYSLMIDPSYTRKFLTNKYDAYYDLKYKCPISPEKAKSLDEKQISILLVGHIVGAEFLSGASRITTPKISDYSPTESWFESLGIPFKPTEIICYSAGDGEIIDRKKL